METIGKFAIIAVVILVLGTGLYYATIYNYRDFRPAPIASVAAVQAPPTQFSEVGTIVYYMQQGTEVPYLVYVKRGTTYSKALEFSDASTCVSWTQVRCPSSVDELKRTYGSGPVHVQGTPNEESLVITRIANAPA